MTYISSTPTVFNVKNYGALGDGVTDDLPAFNRAIAAANVLATTDYPTPPYLQYNSLVSIYVPPGTYILSGPLYLNRSMRIYGDNMGTWVQGYELFGVPSTVLSFPKGSAGIIIVVQGSNYDGYNPSPHPTNTTGRFSVIEHLSMFGGWTGADPGTKGGVPLWQPSTSYSLGDVVTPTYFLKYGYAYKCVSAHTSGSLEPVWATAANPFPLANYTTPDGKWKLLRADGIILNDLAEVRNCRIIGFASNGIACFADVGSGTGANGIRLENCWLGYNGASGLAIAGGDTNAGNTIGLTTHHNGGFGIYDYALLGNSHIGCQSAGNKAGAYWIRSSTMIHPYSESGDGPFILESQATCMGGTFGDGIMSGDYFPDWQATHSYAINDIILESTSGQYWIANTAGTSSGSRPNFTTNNGAPFGRNFFGTYGFVTDGGVQWFAYSEAGLSCAPTWRPNTSYPDRAIVRATSAHAYGNAWQNRSGSSFTSDPTTEPTWNTAQSSTTNEVTGGGVWTELAKGEPPAAGVLVISQSGQGGMRCQQIVNRLGTPTVRLNLSSLNDPTSVLSWTSDDESHDLYSLQWDSTNKLWSWSVNSGFVSKYTQVAGSGYTGPEGSGQVMFPLGVWVGEFNDPTAPSYFNSTKTRLDGGRGVNGHYVGAVDIVRDGYLSNDKLVHVAHSYALPNDPLYGALTEVVVRVLAKDLSTGEMAVFLLRGSWYNKNGTVTVVGAPKVVYGEPTDANHCTAGATGYTAVLVLNGTNVEVQVQNGGNQTNWYVFREGYEGTRT